MAATATQPFTEERVQVCESTVRVLRGGAGETIVTLHHSTGNVGWLPLHERLAEHFSVVAPDMPGYGQSERPEWARDPRDLAILVNHTLEQLGLDRVTLVGFGFGGFIAAELATMDASRLKALVLVGAAGLKPRDGEIMDGMLMDLNEYMAAGFRDDAAFHSVFGEEPDASVKELWDFSREMTARVCWKPYMYNRHLPHLLHDVRTPTLLIWGGEDKVIPPVCGEQYRDAMPGARLEVIPGAGHYVEHEDPARIAGLITAHARA